MLDTPEDFMLSKLQRRQADGILRRLPDVQQLIDFCSNDYLGFAQSPVLQGMIEAELKAIDSLANGSTGSRLLSGNSAYAVNLEKEMAVFYGWGSALLYNSGYDANLGLFSSLPQRGDTVLHDELIHASIIDGICLSNATRYSFRHNNIEHLKQKLKHSTGRRYVIVESVYSMDGDTAPLEAIAEVCYQHQAALIVDEAHATGVFGKGLIHQLNLQNKVFACIVTFGKALGGHGAMVLGSDTLKKYLVNFSRPFIYTTAAPLHQLATTKAAHQLLTENTDAISKLQQNIYLFKENLSQAKLPFQFIKSESAIQCIVVGNIEKAKYYAQQLQLHGFDVRPILSPTVAASTERLRIILHAFNTPDQIRQLCITLTTLTHDI